MKYIYKKMGIPSYFRHILKKFPTLITGADPTNHPHNSDILLVDFNCIVYGCLRSKNIPVYHPDSQRAWEKALIEEIKSYVLTIWRASNSPKTVYLAVDGVVPMAKIRQQRLRRFKGVWLAQKEREAGIRAEHTWDSNAITPGTQFMERLSDALKELCSSRGTGWSVSGAEHPGEGEQKLMEWLRSQPHESIHSKNITVYGLDADLIVLSLLHSTLYPSVRMSILRESQDFGKGLASMEEFTVLSVEKLLEIMFPQNRVGSERLQHIYDYIAGMTLLGNDFLPHSIGFTIRDSGHDRLLKALDALHRSGLTLTDSSQQIVKDSLVLILKSLSESEEADINKTFYKKYNTLQPAPKSEEERAMIPVQNLPIQWAEEKTMWKSGTLYENWADMYYMNETEPFGECDIYDKCIAYFKGLQWVVNYYIGKPVSTEWMYAWTYPPLWKDLYTVGQTLDNLPACDAPVSRRLKPQEQLALVLPYESWSLIRNPDLRSLPTKMPHFWKTKYEFHSLGKRWLWECNPNIPIITPKRLYKEISL